MRRLPIGCARVCVLSPVALLRSCFTDKGDNDDYNRTMTDYLLGIVLTFSGGGIIHGSIYGTICGTIFDSISGNIFGTRVGLNVKLLLHYFESVLSTDP